jgi:hypothetical protein
MLSEALAPPEVLGLADSREIAAMGNLLLLFGKT